MQQIERKIKCQRTLQLTRLIIEGSNKQEELNVYFPGDDLFTPFERRRGLPLGNQTSQFFANVYLNPLDHFVAREVQPGRYLRYVDDFLLFGEDKAALAAGKQRIERFLYGLRLEMHPRKTRIYRVKDGVTFLGWRMFPEHRRLVRANVIRFRRNLRRMTAAYHAGLLEWDDLNASVQAWIGHAGHGDTFRLMQQIFDSCILVPAVYNRSFAARRLLEQ